jgi:hypothetical protein
MDDGTKKCKRCSEMKSTSDFRIKKGTNRAGQPREWLDSYCAPCSREYQQEHYRRTKIRRQQKHAEWRVNNRVKLRGYRLKSEYGISLDIYEQMYETQRGCCWICGDHQEVLCVDHSHSTLDVRGLLCRDCNLALGKFKDDILVVKRAVAYLEMSE